MKASLNPLASIVMCISACKILWYSRALTFAVGKADSKSLSLRLALADVGGRVPNPAAVTAHIGRELHVGNHYSQLSIAEKNILLFDNIIP
jgi:hypothetical protein